MTDETQDQARLLKQIAAAIDGCAAASGARGRDQPGSGAPPTIAVSHLAQLAHELKTPLSAIVAAAEIMRDERFGPVGDPRYRGYAADIYESANHALGVIAAMLAPTARDTTGSREAMAVVEIDMNDLVERVASSVRALLGAAGIEILARPAAGLPHVIADPMAVRQVLLNLVTNAMRATPAGGMITIATAYDVAGPVRIAISDTGVGMTAAEIAVALDGARAADSTPTADGGRGIGYPLVLLLARANGATVSIDSAVGTGTTVTLAFDAGRVIPV